jgi:hypothetical protein
MTQPDTRSVIEMWDDIVNLGLAGRQELIAGHGITSSVSAYKVVKLATEIHHKLWVRNGR